MPDRDDQLVLAVDIGTTGLKVGFVSVTGRVGWQDHFSVVTQWGKGGSATQDAEEWWTIITDAARKAIANGDVNGDDVVAVSITGQWASTVPVDAAGHPVAPCVMWLDARGGNHLKKRLGGPIAGYSPRALAAWIPKTGGIPGEGTPAAHILHWTNDEPDVARAARWYLEPVDYLSMRFTGIAAASHASMTGSFLTDNRHCDVLEYDRGLVDRLGLDSAKLPPLVPTGSIIGPVTPEVADHLGIPATAKVVTGTLDLHTAAVGAGAIGDFEANMAISTTSWISCPLPFKKTDIAHLILSIPGLTPDRYLMFNNQDTAGMALQWLRDNIMEGASYDDLIALVDTVSPGAGKVIFTPWLAGEHSPVDSRKLRGGFHNVSLSTTKAHLVRAVLEGVALNARWLLAYAEKFTKHRLDPIRLIGGGAQSSHWCQIVADVTGRTIERVDQPLHAGIRGAAIFAGMTLGVVDPGEVRSLVTVDRTFVPDSANREIYDLLYGEFSKLAKQQKAMFARLNKKRH